MSADDVSRVLREYFANIKAAKVEHPTAAISSWYGEFSLSCFTLDPSKCPKGFRVSTTKWRSLDHTQIAFQYDLRTLGLGRPKACRVAYLDSEDFMNSEMSVSHLCHNTWCLNPRHHVLESLAENKGRNGCPGGDHCHHRVRCLRPGPFYDTNSVVVHEEWLQGLST